MMNIWLWDKTLGGQKGARFSRRGAGAPGTSLQEIADIVFDSGDVSKLTGQRIYEKSAEFTSDRDASMAFHDSVLQASSILTAHRATKAMARSIMSCLMTAACRSRHMSKAPMLARAGGSSPARQASAEPLSYSKAATSRR
jgi:hypothetical protein